MGNSALDEPVNIGSRLELFVDRYLIDRMSGTELRLNHPVDAGNVLSFDQPRRARKRFPISSWISPPSACAPFSTVGHIRTVRST